jgi:uncharacterized OB-fold protein
MARHPRADRRCLPQLRSVCPEKRREAHLAETGKAEAAGEKKQNPIVPYLRLPKAPGEKAYLAGVKCKSCGAAYVGTRVACGKCFAVDNFKEIRFSNRGTLRAFTIVFQTAPGIEVPFIAAIVDMPEGTAVRANIGGVDPTERRWRRCWGRSWRCTPRRCGPIKRATTSSSSSSAR